MVSGPGRKLARTRQARLERPQRAADDAGRLLVFDTLQVNERDDCPVMRGQRLDDGLHERLQLPAFGDLVRHPREIGNTALHQTTVGLDHLVQRWPLDLVAALAAPQLVDAGVDRDAVQPRPVAGLALELELA